jgi:hypothetical protein
MATEAAKALYKERAATAEQVNAQTRDRALARFRCTASTGSRP